jgi:hypothetical protein
MPGQMVEMPSTDFLFEETGGCSFRQIVIWTIPMLNKKQLTQRVS